MGPKAFVSKDVDAERYRGLRMGDPCGHSSVFQRVTIDWDTREVIADDRFAAGGAAPGHAEQGVQGHRLIVGLLEARRHHAQQAGELKNLVVPGEVAHRHRVQARV